MLLDEAGKDATESFEDVGHSDEARDIMSKLYVGEYQAGVSDFAGSQPHPSFTLGPSFCLCVCVFFVRLFRGILV